MARTHSAHTIDALRVLALAVAAARRSQRRSIKEVAERVGVSVPTIRKVESGDPTVAIGTVFEVASLLGVPLFDANRTRLGELIELGEARLALLPDRVREPVRVADDAF